MSDKPRTFGRGPVRPLWINGDEVDSWRLSSDDPWGARPGEVLHFHWWSDETGQAPPRRDYYSTRKWKQDPAGEPFRVGPDGTVDLHPSQWRVHHA